MKKPLFNKVTIVGVGLIGGSLGMAIKKRRLAAFVTGVVRRKETVSKAFQLKALDAATLDLKKGVQDADLVILCAPVLTIRRQIKQIAPHLKKGALVIDVGSSKEDIQNAGSNYLRRNTFIGCHPMAGSEKRGIEFAKSDLFKNEVCFMTSEDARISLLWKRLGSKTVRVNAREHDEWVSKASHFSHLFSFVQFLMMERLPSRILRSIRGSINPSLRPAARLAKSDAGLWAEILISNRRRLLEGIKESGLYMEKFKTALQKGNAVALRRLIIQANLNSKRLMPDDCP